MFKYTIFQLAHGLWVNSYLRRCLMSRPRYSLLGPLWLQFHWLTKRSQTLYPSLLEYQLQFHWLTRRSQTLYINPLESWLQFLWLCRNRLTLLEPEYCPTSLHVRIARGSVSSWLAPVLLWSAQFLNQASTSVSHEGPYQIHLIKQSYYEKTNSKLNEYRDFNTQLCWLSHTITHYTAL